MLLVILALICIIATICIALFLGSYNTTFFDFKNLNLANMMPALIIGGFISCIIICITVLFVSRSIFLKVKDYFIQTNENNGGNQK